MKGRSNWRTASRCANWTTRTRRETLQGAILGCDATRGAKTALCLTAVSMPFDPLDRLRELCPAFPESSVRLAWGEPTFRAGEKWAAIAESRLSLEPTDKRDDDLDWPPMTRPTPTGWKQVREHLAAAHESLAVVSRDFPPPLSDRIRSLAEVNKAQNKERNKEQKQS